MNNLNYWQERALRDEMAIHNISLKYVEEYKKVYKTALRKINEDILKATQKFTENNKMNYTDMYTILKNKELKKYKINLEEYILKAKENPKSKEVINASLSHRINKLQSLRMQITNELVELTKKQEKITNKCLSEVYQESYYRSGYNNYIISGEEQYIQQLDTLSIDKAISQSWFSDGKNFSNRLWNNTVKLNNTVYKHISQGIALGKTPYDLIDSMKSIFGKDINRISTLLYTETSAMRAKATEQRYKDSKVKKYIIICSLDERTCDICGQFDKKVFDVKDGVVGVNLNPFHPNCRCTSGAYFDFMGDSKDRVTKNIGTGKNEKIKNISYEEWKNKFVGTEKLKMAQKIHQNKELDKKQYEKYKKLLGSNFSFSFDEYINMKYNNASKWEVFKNYKQVLVNQDLNPFIPFEEFEKVSQEINEKLIGLTTVNGITIQGAKPHFIARVIGETYYKDRYPNVNYPQLKNYGYYEPLNVDYIVECLINGDVLKPKINSTGRFSQIIYKGNIRIVINPETKDLIQGNKTKDKG